VFKLQNKNIVECNYAIHWQSPQIGLLYREEQSDEQFWETLEDLRDNVLDHEGQFLSLNLAEPLLETLPEMFYNALNNVRWERSLSFSLPAILQHNPHVASPFINNAILWQRLCDLLIIDDEPYRNTVLILENVDLTSPVVQHETARLIRFHRDHFIQRTFIFTLGRHSFGNIIPELQNILEI
jgi:hypothetical protein